MFSALMQSIIEKENIPVLSAGEIDDYFSKNGDVALLISGPHERLVEVNDVAVIYPELIKAFKGRLSPAVIDRADERELQLRYRFNAFPAIIFVREGEYLGAITRLLDWTEYLETIQEILSRQPMNPPSFEFPEGCISAGMKQ